MSETERGQRATQLQKLGAEYGNLTDRKLGQWLDMTDHASPEQVEKAVDRILRDPEREHLPRIGQILAHLPQRPGKERRMVVWNWITLSWQGDLDDLSSEKRESEAAFALRLFPVHWRNAGWFVERAKPMILAFDPDAFRKEAERAGSRTLLEPDLAK